MTIASIRFGDIAKAEVQAGKPLKHKNGRNGEVFIPAVNLTEVNAVSTPSGTWEYYQVPGTWYSSDGSVLKDRDTKQSMFFQVRDGISEDWSPVKDVANFVKKILKAAQQPANDAKDLPAIPVNKPTHEVLGVSDETSENLPALKKPAYEVLGVSENATPEEIKAAYYEKAKAFFADPTFFEDPMKESAAKEVRAAYKRLIEEKSQ